jgi:hypothetical protein
LSSQGYYYPPLSTSSSPQSPSKNIWKDSYLSEARISKEKKGTTISNIFLKSVSSKLDINKMPVIAIYYSSVRICSAKIPIVSSSLIFLARLTL